MNDTVLKELKTVVERAVRPIRATLARKRRMREELLAHLMAVFDEEAARCGDEQAALEQAKQRFGDPKELAGQLQQSVPRWDRCRSILETMGCGPGESAWHLAGKHFLLTLVIYSVALALWVSVLLHAGFLQSLALETRRELAKAAVFGLPVVTLMNVFLSVIMASLLHKFGPTLASKRWGRFLLLTLAAVGLCALVAPVTFAGAGVLFVLMARQTVKQWRYEADWA